MISDERMKKTLKYSSLGILVVQNVSTIIFMKYAMTGDRPKFIKAITVFYSEILKVLASIVLCCISHRSLIKGLMDIYTECAHKKRDFAKILIPAAVYTIQNILLYVAIENLPATTYMVTYQLKILTTALFSVFILRRPLSILQWIALFILFAGVAVVQYDQKMSDDREKAELAVNSTLNATITNMVKETSSLIGFVSVLIACVLSGFAGIYFEKILKSSSVSLWVRNFQLAAPSVIFALLIAFGKDNKMIFADGFNPASVGSNMMQGFDWAVWTTVAINAFGGIIISVVVKYADNILKAFASSIVIIVNCVIAYFLFSFHPTILFGVGACLVIGAVSVYSIFPYRSNNKKEDVEETVDGDGKVVDENENEKDAHSFYNEMMAAFDTTVGKSVNDEIKKDPEQIPSFN